MNRKVGPTHRDIMFKMKNEGFSYQDIRDYLFVKFGLSITRQAVFYNVNREYRQKDKIRSHSYRLKKKWDNVGDLRYIEEKEGGIEEIFEWLNG